MTSQYRFPLPVKRIVKIESDDKNLSALAAFSRAPRSNEAARIFSHYPEGTFAAKDGERYPIPSYYTQLERFIPMPTAFYNEEKLIELVKQNSAGSKVKPVFKSVGIKNILDKRDKALGALPEKVQESFANLLLKMEQFQNDWDENVLFSFFLMNEFLAHGENEQKYSDFIAAHGESIYEDYSNLKLNSYAHTQQLADATHYKEARYSNPTLSPLLYAVKHSKQNRDALLDTTCETMKDILTLTLEPEQRGVTSFVQLKTAVSGSNDFDIKAITCEQIIGMTYEALARSIVNAGFKESQSTYEAYGRMEEISTNLYRAISSNVTAENAAYMLYKPLKFLCASEELGARSMLFLIHGITSSRGLMSSGNMKNLLKLLTCAHEQLDDSQLAEFYDFLAETVREYDGPLPTLTEYKSMIENEPDIFTLPPGLAHAMMARSATRKENTGALTSLRATFRNA